MLEERKKYQAEMAKYPFGTTEYDVYFNLQTAVKVHMNALYGAMLYHNFRLATREVGETITYMGRFFNNWILDEVELLGFKGIYGDSVVGDTLIPVIGYKLRKNITIKDLFKLCLNRKFCKYIVSGEKEIIDLSDTNIKTISLAQDQRKVTFKNKILKIIRHKTNKCLYKIVSETGKEFTVTEDHSLIVLRNKNYICIKPTEVQKNDYLITVDEFLKNKVKTVNKIKEFIEDCLEVNLEKITLIRPLEQTNEYVYDLEVENNHSFLANGVIVHNTDSIFYKSHLTDLQEIIKEFIGVNDHLNEMLPKKVVELGGDIENCHIKIEPKKIYSKLLLAQLKSKKENRAAKKRYAGRAVWEGGKIIDEPDIMGFEVRRANSSQLSRELQKKVLKVLLGYEPEENLRKYVQEAEKEFKKEEPNWELISIPQSINALESYKVTTPHVRGAKYANEYFGEKFKAGDKPKMVYVVLSPPGYPRTDVICFRNKPPAKFVVDSSKMFEKSVELKLEHIFSTAGINVQEVLYGSSTLDQFC
jgi:DNA polymerase elongation subunit (family B)